MLDPKDALLRSALRALHGTRDMLEKILDDDDDIVISQSVLTGGFVEDTQREIKPEFSHQFAPDYIPRLRKETFATVATLSGQPEDFVERVFRRINWKAKGEQSPENQIRARLYPPLPKHAKQDFSKWMGGSPTKAEEEEMIKHKMALNEAEMKIRRVIFLLRNLRAESGEQSRIVCMAETRKQQRLRVLNRLTRLYGVEHV